MSRTILVLSFLAALSAHASDRPKVVVVPFVAGEGATDAAASKFSLLVADEIRGRPELELVSPLLKAPPPPPPAPKAAPPQRQVPTPEAIAAMHAGRAAFEDLRFEDAVREFRRGLEGMLQDPATADYDNVQDAHMKLAAAMFRLGMEKEAKNALVDLARFNPSFELPPGYPPVFQRELEKAKKRLDKQPRGQISIDGPPGSTAFVDGRDLGMVPVVEENVPAGLHYVKVEGTKNERFGQIVEVKGGVAKVKAVFQSAAPVAEAPRPAAAPASDAKIGPSVDDAMKERVAAYARAAGADFALIGVVSRVAETQLVGATALFGVRKGGFVALEAQVFDTDVLTANTEAFKLVDDLARKAAAFPAVATLPISLAPKKGAVVATRTSPKPDAKAKPDDVEAATPTARREALVPKEARPLDHKSTVVDLQAEPPEEKKKDEPPAVKSGGVPVWVWIATGVAVAAGAGVGGYFGYTAMTKPVTGTVTATW